MSGLWLAAGLLGIAAFGFVMFHLGVRAAWADAEERMSMMRWAKERERR